jgi:hypothetical protein
MSQTLQVQGMEKRMRAAFEKFKSIYPETVFPDVYFLIGVTSSGGTTGPTGLLIGTEMYGKTPKSPMEELSDWLRVVLSTVCRQSSRTNRVTTTSTTTRLRTSGRRSMTS